MDYIKIIDSLRELARDSLRLSLVSGLKADRFSFEKESSILAKELAVLNYELANLDTEHPNYDKQRDKKENVIVYYSDSITSNAKTLKGIDDKIADVVSGKTKVSKDDLACETDKLITAYVREKARDLE